MAKLGNLRNREHERDNKEVSCTCVPVASQSSDHLDFVALCGGAALGRGEILFPCTDGCAHLWCWIGTHVWITSDLTTGMQT